MVRYQLAVIKRTISALGQCIVIVSLGWIMHLPSISALAIYLDVLILLHLHVNC